MSDPFLDREGQILANLMSAAQEFGAALATEAAVPEAVRQAQGAAWDKAMGLIDERAAAMRERDEAREAARKYLPHVKYSFDDLNRGKRCEARERQQLDWLGEPETPLEEL